MSGPTTEKSLMQVITQTIDSLSSDGKNYDALINILSLICVITILNRSQSQQTQTAVTTANPLQKLLSELNKGDGHSNGPSPDMLMSLLPLLNSPQLKSKLNPSNIAAIMGLVNSIGGSSEKQDPAKPDKENQKPESKPTDSHTTSVEAVAPAAAVTASSETSAPRNTPEADDHDKKGLGRYLNWKTNF